MTRTLLISIAILCASAQAEEIYRDVDDDGVPVFSDHQAPGSEKFEVREPMIFSDPVAKKKLQEASKPEPAEGKSIEYKLVITEPANDEAVRDNAGNLTLTVAIQPSPRSGHKAELLMDGLMIRRISAGGPVSLSNVDRGTHKFSIRVVNADGDTVAEGPSTSITMLRFSKLHRAN